MDSTDTLVRVDKLDTAGGTGRQRGDRACSLQELTSRQVSTCTISHSQQGAIARSSISRKDKPKAILKHDRRS